MKTGETDPRLPAMRQERPAFDAIRLLRRLGWIPLVTLLLGLGAAVWHYKTSPKWYQAEILIVPRPTSAGALGSARSMMGGLPIEVAPAQLAYSDGERIAAILKSRSVTDAVIEKFRLVDRYEVGVIEKARAQLWSLCATSVQKKSNLVSLRCEDRDPAVARDLADYVGRMGDAGFRRIAVAAASEERRFLETRVDEARRDLEVASGALRGFQEEHRIIDLPEQSKAVVSAMAHLEGDLIAKRVELAYLRGFASEDESSAGQLRRQIGILKSELRNLEGRAAAAGATARDGSEVFPRAMEVPALRAELERLHREEKVRESVFLLLTEKYETLKVDEARDLSNFVVFDEAATPTYRVRPRLRVVPIGGAAGLLFGLVLVLVPAWWRDLLRRAARERGAAASR